LKSHKCLIDRGNFGSYRQNTHCPERIAGLPQQKIHAMPKLASQKVTKAAKTAKVTQQTLMPTPWLKKMPITRAAKVVILEKAFAGTPAGAKLLIATPAIFAKYLMEIPKGEGRSIVRVRNELARRHRAQATCPVTTAIFLRIVAESAMELLNNGAKLDAVAPFWRVIEPDSTIAKKLKCDSEWLRHVRVEEGIMDDNPETAPKKQKASHVARAKSV
jgi:hypothetical protein